MESSTELLPISLDRPASVDEALAADKLERRGFAEEIVRLLRNVGPDASFALSIEGPWGSGKTQVLHMIEALLRDETQSTRPVLVHFNPWLVGDKDALLRQFFAQMAAALELTEHVSNAKSAAQQLISYAKVFDVVKWVPGAEPWASIMKGVLEATGTGVQAAAEQKSLGLEEQKAGVEEALRKFGRRIIVFIDDVDRLYPQEVFEMIRIVKSVGDLSNIGYIVAWDHAYVCEALRHASVPFPQSYLDKVIQQRVVMPTLSSSGRERLIEAQWKQVDAAAFEPRFRRSERRYAMMYGYGTFELLEHPRDVARAFNVLRMLEKRVRGNVVLADLIAFSILQVKAAPVCALVRSNRRWFAGKGAGDLTDIAADTDDEKRNAIESALAACALPWLVRRVINFLFPIAFHAGGASLVRAAEGHIGDPGRLEIVLKQGADNHDIDYVLVRSYVFDPQKRKEIETGIPMSRAYEFVNTIADFVDETVHAGLAGMLPGLCLSLAAYADSAEFASRSRGRVFLQPFGARVILVAIERIAKKIDSEQRASVAKRITMNAESISLGALLVDASYRDKDSSDVLCCQPEDQDIAVDGFCSNVMDAARDARFPKLSGLDYVLHVMNDFAPQRCQELFSIIRATPAQLDAFILALADHGMDSVNGQRYALVRSQKVVESFCSLEDLSGIARKRLDDKTLVYPERAAWQAALDGKIYYGADGTEATR